MASFVINELKQVGHRGHAQADGDAQWHAMATRGEYQIGANLTGIGPDDPDANFYENYACGSPRNYSQYCSEEVMKMIDQQSQEIDPKKRLAMVHAIQKKLEEEAARPMLDWRLDYFTHWPHVKSLVPHHTSTTSAGCRTCGATSSQARRLAREDLPRSSGSRIAVLTLLGMSIVIFVLLRLAPGDIVDILFSTARLREPGREAGHHEGAGHRPAGTGSSTSSGCARS